MYVCISYICILYDVYLDIYIYIYTYICISVESKAWHLFDMGNMISEEVVATNVKDYTVACLPCAEEDEGKAKD